MAKADKTVLFVIALAGGEDDTLADRLTSLLGTKFPGRVFMVVYGRGATTWSMSPMDDADSAAIAEAVEIFLAFDQSHKTTRH